MIIKEIKSKINKAIKFFNMFTRTDKILLGISGGSDSVLLTYILKEMGYKIELIFIDLGIGFSKESSKIVEKNSNILGLKLHVLTLKNELGFTLDDIYREYKKYTCRQCGVIKRYLLNYFALKNNFDVVVTGHNMDDEVESLLSNNLRWDMEHIYKTYPVLEAKNGFVKRCKPMCYLRKSKIKEGIEKLGLSYYSKICDYSLLGSRIKYRSIIEKIDSINSNLITDYYIKFLNIRELFKKDRKVHKCSCGNYTTSDKCGICRIKENIFKKF